MTTFDTTPPTSHSRYASQICSAGGFTSTDTERLGATHHPDGVGRVLPTPASAQPLTREETLGLASSAPTSHLPCDLQSTNAGGGTAPSTPHPRRGTQPTDYSGEVWEELRLWSETLMTYQDARIATENRLRGGLQGPLIDADLFTGLLAPASATEALCKKALRTVLRRIELPELLAWQENTPGIGDYQLARFLGHLGHPLWATPHHWEGTGSNRVLVADPPHRRSVAQLRQYCGHGAPARRTKGMTFEQLASQGSPMLKKIVWGMVDSSIKNRRHGSPYAALYDLVKSDLEGRTHTAECVRCGPSGRPAGPDTPWKPGHIHAHAMRVVGKQLLKDIWLLSGGSDLTEVTP
jgi:hypothetical protein